MVSSGEIRSSWQIYILEKEYEVIDAEIIDIYHYADGYAIGKYDFMYKYNFKNKSFTNSFRKSQNAKIKIGDTIKIKCSVLRPDVHIVL